MVESPVKEARSTLFKTAIVTGVSSLILFLIPGGWPAVWKWASYAINALWSLAFSNFSLPVWLVVVLSVCTLFAIGTPLIIWFASRGSNDGPDYPKEMTVFGIHWRWAISPKFGVHRITSFCPDCDYQIYARSQVGRWDAVNIVYLCENCDWRSQPFDVTPEEIEDRVVRKVHQEMRSKRRKAEETH